MKRSVSFKVLKGGMAAETEKGTDYAEVALVDTNVEGGLTLFVASVEVCAGLC